MLPVDTGLLPRLSQEMLPCVVASNMIQPFEYSNIILKKGYVGLLNQSKMQDTSEI